MVDANGVLVLLKFLNQDFAKVVDFTINKADQKFDFIYEVGSQPLDLERVMERSIIKLVVLLLNHTVTIVLQITVAAVLDEKSDAHINVVLVRNGKVAENGNRPVEENPEFQNNN